mgnify:FL=1
MIKFTVKPLTDEHIPQLCAILSKANVKDIVLRIATAADTKSDDKDYKRFLAVVGSLPALLSSVPDMYADFKAFILSMIETEEDTANIKAADFIRICQTVFKSEDFADFFKVVAELFGMTETAEQGSEPFSQSSTSSTATPEA